MARPILRAAATFTAAWVMVACAHHTRPPSRPTLAFQRDVERPPDLYLSSFSIEDEGGVRGLRQPDRIALQERFLDFLESKRRFSTIHIDTTGTQQQAMAEHDVRLDVVLRLSQTTHRTYILDLLAMTPYTFGILTPWWGHVDIAMDVTTTTVESGTPRVTTATYESQTKFNSVFFTWYRTRFVEEAYTKAYAEAFTDAADDLDVHLTAIAANPRPRRPIARMPQKHAVEENRTVIGMRISSKTTPPHPSPVPAVGEAPVPPVVSEEDLLRSSPVPAASEAAAPPMVSEPDLPPREPWQDALSALGGVELAGITGVASISSTVRDEFGTRTEIASGTAKQSGWRLALYGAPKESGFFVYPTAGYLSQKIEIADFSEYVPIIDAPDAVEIGGVCSNPTTGASIDCDQPTTYNLNLQSFYGGARAGYDMVVGNDTVRGFASTSAGANIIERRSLNTLIYNGSLHSSEWAVLQSFALGASTGIAFPKVRLAFRLIVDMEFYRRFKYGDALQFDGPVAFDEERSVYYRPKMDVKSARLSTWTVQIATAATF